MQVYVIMQVNFFLPSALARKIILLVPCVSLFVSLVRSHSGLWNKEVRGQGDQVQGQRLCLYGPVHPEQGQSC